MRVVPPWHGDCMAGIHGCRVALLVAPWASPSRIRTRRLPKRVQQPPEVAGFHLPIKTNHLRLPRQGFLRGRIVMGGAGAGIRFWEGNGLEESIDQIKPAVIRGHDYLQALHLGHKHKVRLGGALVAWAVNSGWILISHLQKSYYGWPIHLRTSYRMEAPRDIETQAYVVEEPNGDFKLMDIILDEVREHEYLIEMKYSGICHTVRTSCSPYTAR
nr:hypothetical protein CFP56_09445 [Quercus suber]